MIFLLDNALHESPATPTLAPAVGHIPAAQLRAPTITLIATTAILETAVTRSKQTSAPHSNRYFFPTLTATSRPYYPPSSSPLANSNRHFRRLETSVTQTKQSTGTISNRHQFRVSSHLRPARPAQIRLPILAPRTPRA